MIIVGAHLVRQHGWRYLFHGLGVTILRAFPVNGMIFPVYELSIYCCTNEVRNWDLSKVREKGSELLDDILYDTLTPPPRRLAPRPALPPAHRRSSSPHPPLI